MGPSPWRRCRCRCWAARRRRPACWATEAPGRHRRCLCCLRPEGSGGLWVLLRAATLATSAGAAGLRQQMARAAGLPPLRGALALRASTAAGTAAGQQRPLGVLAAAAPGQLLLQQTEGPAVPAVLVAAAPAAALAAAAEPGAAAAVAAAPVVEVRAAAAPGLVAKRQPAAASGAQGEVQLLGSAPAPVHRLQEQAPAQAPTALPAPRVAVQRLLQVARSGRAAQSVRRRNPSAGLPRRWRGCRLQAGRDRAAGRGTPPRHLQAVRAAGHESAVARTRSCRPAQPFPSRAQPQRTRGV